MFILVFVCIVHVLFCSVKHTSYPFHIAYKFIVPRYTQVRRNRVIQVKCSRHSQVTRQAYKKVPKTMVLDARIQPVGTSISSENGLKLTRV